MIPILYLPLSHSPYIRSFALIHIMSWTNKCHHCTTPTNCTLPAITKYWPIILSYVPFNTVYLLYRPSGFDGWNPSHICILKRLHSLTVSHQFVPVSDWQCIQGMVIWHYWADLPPCTHDAFLLSYVMEATLDTGLSFPCPSSTTEKLVVPNKKPLV